MARIDAAIAERAQIQLGLLTINDLDAIGCTRAMRRSLLDRRALEQIGPRVHALVGTPRDSRRLTLAACLSTAPDAVASHRAAAWLWDMPGSRAPEPEISLTRRSREPSAIHAIVHRPVDLPARDVTRIGPIPITTRVRTLIDCAAVWPRSLLETAVDGLVRDAVVRRRALVDRALALRSPGRPGVGTLLDLLGEGAGTAGRPETWLEKEFLRVLRGHGIPLPATQVVVALPGGSARLDFAYVAQHLAFEIDGHATHSTRRERQADAERNARLTLAGWTTQHFTYEDVTERPRYVANTVRQLLVAAGQADLAR